MNFLKQFFSEDRRFEGFDALNADNASVLSTSTDIQKLCDRKVMRFKRKSRRMKTSGFLDALTGIRFEQESVPLSLQEHTRKGQQNIKAIENIIDQRKRELSVDYEKSENDLDNKSKRLAQYSAINADARNKVYSLTRKKEQLEAEKSELLEKKKRLLQKRYQGNPPEITRIDRPAIFVLVSLAIYAIEIPFTKLALDKMVDEAGNAMFENLEAAFAATILSAILTLSAKMGAHAISKRQFFEGSLGMIPGLAICAGILWLRSDEYLVLGLLPFVFFMTYALISYTHSKNSEWFSTLRSLKKIEAKLTKIGTALQSWTIETDRVSAADEMQYDKMLQAQKDRIGREFQVLDNLKNEYTGQIQEVFDEGWFRYLRAYERLAGLRSRRVMGRPVAPKLISSNDNGSDNGQFSLFPVLNQIVILILASFLVSCSPPASHALAVVVDQTVDMKVQPDAISAHIQNEILGPEDLDLRSPIDVSIWTIGENSRQKRIAQIRLSQGDIWAFRNDGERRQEIEVFFSDLDTLLAYALIHKDSLGYSYVYENIAAPLEHLSSLPAQTSKSVLVLSDGLQHTPGLSWYRRLPAPDDYEETAQTLVARKRLPSLSGTSIYWCFVPDRNNDKAFDAALNFFTWLYETHGAQVAYVPGM